MVVDHNTDFQTYLQSVCAAYEHWWSRYTLTDAVGRQAAHQEKVPPQFDFALIVRALQRSHSPNLNLVKMGVSVENRSR